MLLTTTIPFLEEKMKLIGSILFTLSAAQINLPFAETRDRQCEAIGGDCLNWDWYFCTAGYRSGNRSVQWRK